MSFGRIAARLLTFRLSRAELLGLGHRELALALACTWVVGMGRWWDDPGAGLLQHLGIGSVLYVLVLSLVLWAIVLPLRPSDWTYRRVLTFVALTSPPGILYAIPVERLVDMPAAGQLNLWFLALVAAWRVALLFRFLATVPLIGAWRAIVAGLLPLAAIVTSLTVLNLHRVVFDLMGSIGAADPTAHDAAYGVLVTLTILSWLVLPVLTIAYGVAIWTAHRPSKTSPF